MGLRLCKYLNINQKMHQTPGFHTFCLDIHKEQIKPEIKSTNILTSET